MPSPFPERLGIFGGTFDPVHVGHIVAAVEARRILSLDTVLMVVAGDPWQKRGQVVAPAADRLAVVAAAVAGMDGIVASDIEVTREGPSYTVDTLDSLARPGRELFLIVGADVVAGLGTWRGTERLANLATLAVVDRAGTPQAASPPPPWRCVRVPIPRIDISSTDLRRRAAAGWPLHGFVPAGGCRVLAERKLYR